MIIFISSDFEQHCESISGWKGEHALGSLSITNHFSLVDYQKFRVVGRQIPFASSSLDFLVDVLVFICRDLNMLSDSENPQHLELHEPPKAGRCHSSVV